MLYCTDEYLPLNNNARQHKDDAKALSASWLFLSAKEQAGGSIGMCSGCYSRFHSGLELLRRHQNEIEHGFPWFLRPLSSVTSVTDAETGLLQFPKTLGFK